MKTVQPGLIDLAPKTAPPRPPSRQLPMPGPRTASRTRGLRLRWLWLGLVAVSVLIWIGTMLLAPPPPAATPAPQLLTAHGVVQPIARASVGSLTGGVIEQLAVEVGQTVEAKQLIGRVMLQGEPELLTAPWRGTVTSVSARLGDTVVPGTAVFTIADLGRYQVETTDIDEYLIGYIYPTQAVTMRIEAVEQTQIDGVVRTVGLQQQPSLSGANYPVTIDFAQQDASLRPGMTVRITFAELQG